VGDDTKGLCNLGGVSIKGNTEKGWMPTDLVAHKQELVLIVVLLFI